MVHRLDQPLPVITGPVMLSAGIKATDSGGKKGDTALLFRLAEVQHLIWLPFLPCMAKAMLLPNISLKLC